MTTDMESQSEKAFQELEALLASTSLSEEARAAILEKSLELARCTYVAGMESAVPCVEVATGVVMKYVEPNGVATMEGGLVRMMRDGLTEVLTQAAADKAKSI